MCTWKVGGKTRSVELALTASIDLRFWSLSEDRKMGSVRVQLQKHVATQDIAAVTHAAKVAFNDVGVAWNDSYVLGQCAVLLLIASQHCRGQRGLVLTAPPPRVAQRHHQQHRRYRVVKVLSAPNSSLEKSDKIGQVPLFLLLQQKSLCLSLSSCQCDESATTRPSLVPRTPWRPQAAAGTYMLPEHSQHRDHDRCDFARSHSVLGHPHPCVQCVLSFCSGSLH